jgi:hypothetical protein
MNCTTVPLSGGMTTINCKNLYPIFRTVSDDNASFMQADFRSDRSFAVKPAPVARLKRLWLDRSPWLSGSGDGTFTIIICAEG